MVARAVLDNPQQKLRPNMQVVVQVSQASSEAPDGLMIQAAAVQQVEQQDVVFVASPVQDDEPKSTPAKLHFVPHPVQIGQKSDDQQWIEVRSGLQAGEQYAAQGSFILKSELEKGEAAHEH
jgi:cobalt-zinc-cadmium efflux system membrane fusion protein